MLVLAGDLAGLAAGAQALVEEEAVGGAFPGEALSYGDSLPVAVLGLYWRFTVLSVERLFSGYFREVAVKGYGNVFAAKAFLDGLSVEDVNDTGLLDFYDEDYTVTIGVFARK